MIQLGFVMLCFFSSTFVESGEVLGSRVITSSSGKVGSMYFKSAGDLGIFLHKIGSSRLELLTIRSGECIVDGKILGSPCNMTADRIVITFNEVPDYNRLLLTKSRPVYTVYFVKDCEFPTPEDGEIIEEKSIPLYRFLRGKTEENVVFAMKGTDYRGITLYRDDSKLCEWEDSIPETGECANLIMDNDNGLLIFNATFSKPSNKTFETLTWGRYLMEISVNLDWTNSVGSHQVTRSLLSFQPPHQMVIETCKVIC
ncbi:unnamed protein product [Hymenolepis diminuta]|uniref:DUF5727 domain-containing protein n=1 Tax=Hymenolepis diminuta TaxID=6216 RepID=A0A564XYA3_HYMDI|nr:unnamed protein product [Hymenolepis diminuta]